MWDLAAISIDLTDAEGELALVTIITPAGSLEVMGYLQWTGRVLSITRADIQGLHPGALGRAGLNAILRKLLEVANVDEIIIQGTVRTTGRREGTLPRPIHFPNRKTGSNEA